MLKYDFWKNWKNKTKTEKKAIKSVEKARQLIVNAIPKSKLVAIYIKGSFVRREMKKGSDVDMVPIVAENKYGWDVFAVNKLNIAPVMVVPLSLWEFKHNKLFTKGNYIPDLRAEPDIFLKNLNKCKLIYGKPLDPNKFPIRSNKEILKDEINKIRNGYIPAYEEGIIDFSPLLKEVFWLVELVQNIKGKKVVHSFKGIVRSVEDKNHIIHEAYRFRKNGSNNKGVEKKFIANLKKHLDELEKEI